MVSIIKNQLLKHLSRFTKNLSSDKINLSTFKGEGELSNLELDENVLTDLLELPSWLRLTSAWCNKVSFRIQWTKLKSVPIFLHLDEVHVEVETCEELRSMSVHQGLSSLGSAKYNFTSKVIDGITVAVNDVQVTFKSPAFIASVQLSRVVVESKSPSWETADLRATRVKDSERGQLLVFKELRWQTVRIEAKSTLDSKLTPLRLLTNQACCRITIKKRLSDCFVLGSRLCLLLDDLLWVLTDSQLKAALHFLDSLAGLVQKATELTRIKKAARKLEVLPEYQAQISQQARTATREEKSAVAKLFARYDVIETSYHFVCQRIDFHICDDEGLGRSCHPDLQEGGVLQICLQNFKVDYYPYHLAMGDRHHWPKYKEGATPHCQWLQQSLSTFKNTFLDLLEQGRNTHHVPLSRQQHVSSNQADLENKAHSEPVPPTSPQENQQRKSPSNAFPAVPVANPVKAYVVTQLAKLMTSCMIVRIQNFTLYQVTTTKRKVFKELITGDRQRCSMPEDIYMLHAEFTYYYYPGDIPFPLPQSKLYVQVNPTVIHVDVFSFLWMNAFALGLLQSLSSRDKTQNNTLDSIDVKLEAIMPHIVIESSGKHKNQKDRPKTLHIQISRASITNVRALDHSSRADLAKCVDMYQMGSLFYGAGFPCKEGDFQVVTEKFMQHVSGEDAVRPLPYLAVNTVPELLELLNKTLLWTDAKDVWCVSLEPLWCDFLGAAAVGSDRPVSLVDAFPLTLWVHVNMPPNRGDDADIRVLAHVSTLVSVQLNHYQYLFLLRLMEDLAELTTYLSIDSNKILEKEEGGSVVLAVMAPQVEVTLVMPSQTPGKEYGGGADLDSGPADSVSLPEDPLLGPLDVAETQSRLSSSTVNPITAEAHSAIMSSNIHEIVNGPTTPLPFANVVIPNNLNVGISSVKKGFSNLITSIDSALKSGSDDDTVSLRSDISSDSENYVVVNMSAEERNIDAMFRFGEPQPALEVASEVVEEGTPMSSPSDRSLESACKRKDLVSISTFKLSKVEMFQQSRGFTSAVAVQVSGVQTEDCGSIPWDEFQSKFGCRARAWNDSQADAEVEVRIKARLDHLVAPGPITDRHCFRKWCSDILQAQVNDLALQLNMSTVTGLSDLFEDEVILPPIPLQITLENISVRLNEDRPPSNITSPGPIPIDLTISQLKVHRGLDGVFHIEPPGRGGNDVNKELEKKELELLEQRNLRLSSENAELKRRLSALGRVSEQNHVLRQSAEETQILRSCLAESQEEVAKLLDQKKMLLDRVHILQEQIEQLHRSKR